MYKIGDLIIYGNQGVCRVDEIGIPDISGIAEDKLYYTLSPVYNDGKIFIPVDTLVYMRPVVSKSEAKNIIKQIPKIQAEIIENQNYKVMEDHYKKLLSTHKCTDLIYIIKSVYGKRKAVQLQGKNLGQTDEKFKKIAEELLNSEFALALDIPKNEVNKYIEESIKKIQKGEDML
ncbi:CarD family transcriptional regulator [Aminipila terrae]|uniref:Transcriptional regulator n=1 Tax=Aminipila terrae TaxID=2697030 RepID=A0A6P1MM16_9FIRM|nr:CarD family transcriptional regulator [Aminipila terrae]QHI73704.1 transcriptional regulator [Aminipila terrae]